MMAKYITIKRMRTKVNLTDKYPDLPVFFFFFCNGQHDFLRGERGKEGKTLGRSSSVGRLGTHVSPLCLGQWGASNAALEGSIWLCFGAVRATLRAWATPTCWRVLNMHQSFLNINNKLYTYKYPITPDPP
jgi:hypothetical protein